MKLYFFILSVLLLNSINLYSQQAGEYIYEFLNLGSSARIESMGGKHVSIFNNSSSFSFYNPSYLKKEHDNEISINYTNYLSDINFGYVSYTKSFTNIGNFSLGLHYLNYGEFQGANIYGIIENKFRASDYAFIISWSKTLTDKISIGANIKPIYSSLEKYNSLGVAMDVAINYTSNNKLFTSSIIARNIGYQLKPYYGSHREKLPLEFSLGMCYKLEHAPIQTTLTCININNIKDISDNLILGLELFPTKKLNLRAGYTLRLRKELAIEEKASTVGFSWGFGINLSKFKISYASKKYHVAGSSNIFSISSNINKLFF